MFQQILVHPRVHERHPEIEDADVISACMNAIAFVRRSPFPPDVFIGAGADRGGRLLEFAGTEQEDGSFFVFHAMKLTRKMRHELGI